MACVSSPDFIQRKIIAAGEPTCATHTTANGIVLPAYDVARTIRGTPRISRAGVLDGYTGERRSSAGSAGHAIELPVEASIIAEQAFQAWGLMLLCARMKAVVNTTAETVVWTRSQSTAPAAYSHAAWASNGTIDWTTVSLTDLWFGGNRHNITGCTADWTLRMTVGDRINWLFSVLGLIDPLTGVVDDAPTTESAWNALGTPVDVLPLTFGGSVGATLQFSDAGPGDEPIDLGSVEIANRAAVSDRPDPRLDGGMGVSTPRMPQGPSVSFSLGETVQNRKSYIERFIAQEPVAIDITAGVPGLSLRVQLPQVTFQDFAEEDRDGGKGYAVTGVAERTGSTGDDSVTITLEYGGAASS
jgi:hypothetical protein